MTKIHPITYLVASIAIVYFAYAPGLAGGFVFDDEINFRSINIFKHSTGIDAFINYIISNPTGFLKRPITTLSFLLNASSWPANPYYFKITNLMIHMFNGWLLFLVSKRLLVLNNPNQRYVFGIALLSSLIWLLHPFFVSTVMYANQRFAMLPVTFILLGMLIYIKGRYLLKKNETKAYIFLYASVYVFTSLATLSKENGILFPLLLLILEIVLFKNINVPKISKSNFYFLFYIPLFVILLSLIYKFTISYGFYNSRSFTLSERLLTESRMVIKYLFHLFYPESFTEGLFGDSIPKSSSIIHPLSTLFSLLFILFLLGLSFLKRNIWKLFSFSLFFYFAALLIESTFYPLELYFEHRAYLPTLFIPLIFSVGIFKLIEKNKILIIVPIMLLVFLFFQTFQRATRWGDNFQLHYQSAIKYPNSVRANNIAAGYLYSQGKIEEALQRYESVLIRKNSIGIFSNYMNLRCITDGELDQIDKNKFIEAIKESKFFMDDIKPFTNFILDKDNEKCFQSKYDYVMRVLTIIKASNYSSLAFRVKFTILYLETMINIQYNKNKESLKYFRELINITNTPYRVTKAMNIVATYINMGKYQLAKITLMLVKPILETDSFKRDIYGQKKQFHYYSNVIDFNLKQNPKKD